MKLLSLFSGIGAFEKALDRLGINYHLVNYCEIDKYASKSYAAIHGVSESMNLGDITKVDEKALPKNIDLVTYGFPCQDISLAGKQKGLFNEDGTQTRSGLFFEALRIIEETQPRVAIAENVKNLTSKKFSKQFKIVLDSLEAAGYNSYWQVLNSKDYGVPQNRERVFIVSIRKDIDTGEFKFPEGFPLELRLKDLLEDEVDEKYYLSDSATSKLTRWGNKIVNNDNPECSNTIHAGYYKMGGRDQQYVKDSIAVGEEPQCIQAANLNHYQNDQMNRVYSPDGLAPTVLTKTGGGRDTKILVREATKLGYAEAYEGDPINLEQPNSKTRRGRVGNQVAQTLTTSCNQAVVINPLKDKTPYGWHFEQNVYDSSGITRAVKAGGGSGNIPKVIEENVMTNERAADIMRNEQCCQDDPVFVEAYEKAIDALDNQAVAVAMGRYAEDGTVEQNIEVSDREYANALITVQKDSMVAETSTLRIRKLTPKECFRLMDFDDEDFEKAEAVNSNTQLYKQAGNSIVVACPYYIIKALIEANIFIERENKEMEMKVTEYQLPEKISFNFDELKAELTEKVSMYETMVYTDENIKDAKADRANLNKLKKALNDERIRREKEYMVPFNEFKAQINEIISIIDKPVAVIDKQVKAFEEQQKQDKLDAITNFFNSTLHPEWLHFSQILDEKWLNASTSMKSVQDAIDARLEQITNDLSTLANLPEFGFEATEVYKRSLNMNNAISEAQRMSQIAKAKAEAEAKKAAEQIATQTDEAVFNNAPDISAQIPEQPEEPKQWVKFQAYMTVDQAKALGQYMKANGIEYKAV